MRLLTVFAAAVLIALLSSGCGSESKPTVTLFGADGSFGSLRGAERLPSGHSFTAEAIDGWSFRPGASAYFPAIAPDGTVLIANEPQTDNQAMPTAREMVISSFEPKPKRFRNLLIPTSTGRTTLAGPWPSPASIVGGADVSDIESVRIGGRTQIAFTSAMPYWGWDAARDGTFPTLGYLRRQAEGGWAPDPSRSVEAADVMSAQSTQPCRPAAQGAGVGDCHMPAELAQLPASEDLVITQYGVGDPFRRSGHITVLDAAGAAQATYPYPQITLPDGQALTVHPREVDVDPLGRPGDERFVVIFDAIAANGTPQSKLAPFALQEFRYDEATGTIVPTSLPVLSGATAGGEPLGFETAQYDATGSLWAAQSRVGSLQAGPLAIFHRVKGATSVLAERPGCGAPPLWGGSGWNTTCVPDEAITAASTLGIGRSLTADHATDSMVLATMSGYLLPVTGTADSQDHRAGDVVDLGLDGLKDRKRFAIGPRKGAVDPGRRVLWLPIQQLATPATCARWPCAPARLDQWLARVDLGKLLGSARLPGR